jgi:DNA-binding transcriptional regulator YiaG
MTPAEIRALREARGETQEEFARAVGVRRPTVSDWERGVLAPSRLALRVLATLRADRTA